jgi:hypothetical protein
MDLIGKNVNAVMRRGSAWICRRVAGFSLREAAARCLIVGGILVMPWAVVMALPQRPTGVRGAILGDYLRDVSEGEDFDLEEATWWVRMGTVHSGRREIKPTENWLQWLAGFAYPALWRTQDTEALIAGGRAECSERSMILKAIVESAGHRCRFIGLSGHVMLEVESEGSWRVADPELGIVFDDSFAELQRAERLGEVEARLVGVGLRPHEVAHYLDILASADDNVTLPVGAALSPRLMVIERVLRPLACLFPALCVSLGLTLRRRGLA